MKKSAMKPQELITAANLLAAAIAVVETTRPIVEAGWTDLPEGHCPLLVAENNVRKAENALLECSLLLPLGKEKVDFSRSIMTWTKEERRLI
jgi:hypothetical protein